MDISCWICQVHSLFYFLPFLVCFCGFFYPEIGSRYLPEVEASICPSVFFFFQPPGMFLFYFFFIIIFFPFFLIKNFLNSFLPLFLIESWLAWNCYVNQAGFDLSCLFLLSDGIKDLLNLTQYA